MPGSSHRAETPAFAPSSKPSHIAFTPSRKDIDEAFGGVTFRGVCFGDSPIVAG
jgi:hypothetical protein